jgi:hypothetical protein
MNILDIFRAHDNPRFYNETCTFNTFVKFYHDFSNEEFGPWIAGGCGRQLSLGENDFNDVDVWFSSKPQYDYFKVKMQEHFGNNIYLVYDSENAETWEGQGIKIQLIKLKYFENIDSVFDYFDFTCCQVAVGRDGQVYGPGLYDARNRILKVNRLDPEHFILRYAKYTSYGYIMEHDEFLKIIENNKDISYDFDGSLSHY